MAEAKDTRHRRATDPQAIQDAALVTMRIRNAPPRYNPLTDGLSKPPENLPDTGKTHSPHSQWAAASSLIDEGLWVLSDGGLRLLERYKCDRVAWIEFGEFDAVTWAQDYPARFQRAFKIVRRGSLAIYQYGQRINGHPACYPSPVAAARAVLWPRINERITDPELYMILALAHLADAIEALREIARHGDPAPHECEWAANLIDGAREWIDTGLGLDAAETGKRKALEAARAAHEADPDKLRGRKVKEGASEGGLSQSKWPDRAEEMQAAIDAIHANDPGLSYEKVKRLASRRHGFPLSALKRYTTNPAKKT